MRKRMGKPGVAGGLMALMAVAAMALSNAASGAVIAESLPGNDCSGFFGNPFKSCRISLDFDPKGSPVIIKFDEYANGAFGKIEVNTDLFPSIDGSEFSFVFSASDGSAGSWTYLPGVSDPDINFFVAKGGQAFNLFGVSGADPTAWFTPLNPNNDKPFGLSHLTFYDTGRLPPVGVPEPATLLLIGTALAALGLRRRRKRG